MKKSRTPFFLTGGTALSRYYVGHRYSDDLDLFVVDDSNYSDHVNVVLKLLVESKDNAGFRLDRTGMTRGKDYTQFYVVDNTNADLELKIDLVNDVAAHYGLIETDPVLGQVDSLRNILSNKMTALFRIEPKDVVDIQAIARHQHFNWKSIINEAKTKETGIEPEIVYDLLMSFPTKHLDSIKWINRPHNTDFGDDIKTIAKDILFGRDNSLCSL